MIMDEPTNNLGVPEQHKVLELIRTLKNRGVPVILITHVMPDALAVTDRIIVMHRGRKVAEKSHRPHQRRGAGAIHGWRAGGRHGLKRRAWTRDASQWEGRYRAGSLADRAWAGRSAMANSCDAIIIGAGPAGLATAAALRARGLNASILEKSDAVGAVWRRHYDRLHLHTDRARSGLPGLPISKAYGRYPSRAHVVEYLEAYAAKFGLEPVFNAPVRAVRRDGRAWRVEAAENSRSAPIVVVATGWADYPHAPTWPGMETFGGPILHSSVYRNPAPFADTRVLVVGFGNSGAEIALDLAEAGIDVALSVRGAVQYRPARTFRSANPCLSVPERWLPPRVADAINAPLLRFSIGSHREARLETLCQGAAPIDPGGRTRAAHRRRHARRDT